ncbi:MAG: S8 family serine peptidase, partial [Pseudomonadota bacterium]
MTLSKIPNSTSTQSQHTTAELTYTTQEYNANWALSHIGTREAWDVSTGTGIKVAVLDTGIDLQHHDLNDNLWVNTGEVAGDGIDNDGNGFVDDVHGYNFTSSGAANDPDDVDGHGTHVAGIIAAEANGNGVVGVAPEADIMAVKVLNDSGIGSWTGIARGIGYAVENGAKIINMSLTGGPIPNEIKAAVERAQDAGVLIIAAAGNFGWDQALNPAALTAEFDNVISVAASTQSDTLAGFSNYSIDGTTVDVAAPGTSIRSTTPNDSYDENSGTSMAAPVVAGAAAVIWAANPAMSYKQVIDIIETSVDTLSSLAKPIATNGVINLAKAITMVTPPAPINEAPELDILAIVTELAEDTVEASGITLADLVVADDGVGVNILELVGGDIDAFEIRDGALFLRDGVSLDFETKQSFNLEIAVDDRDLGNGAEDLVSYTLTITDVEETPLPDNPPVDNVSTWDFRATDITGFQPGHQNKGGYTVSDDGTSLLLASQAWQAIALDVTVTTNTVLSFDFASDLEGEIHGVMFASGDQLDPDTAFKLYGTQNWGIQAYSTYDGDGSTERFEIAVGEYFTGDFDRIVFFTDDDVGVGGDSTFSNVTLDDGIDRPDNTGPVATDDGPFAAARDGSVTIDIATLLANDSDADGDMLRFGGITEDAGLTTRIEGGQLVIEGVTTETVLEYQINDGRRGTDRAEIAVSGPSDYSDLEIFDFSAFDITGFQPGHQNKGVYTIFDDGTSLLLASQAWQAIALDVTVTTN